MDAYSINPAGTADLKIIIKRAKTYPKDYGLTYKNLFPVNIKLRYPFLRICMKFFEGAVE
jgi:hypothetical protein